MSHTKWRKSINIATQNWHVFLRIFSMGHKATFLLQLCLAMKTGHIQPKTTTSPECLLELHDAKTEVEMVSEWKISQHKMPCNLIFPNNALMLHNEGHLNLRLCTLYSWQCTCTSMLPKARKKGDVDPLTMVSRTLLASSCYLSSSPWTKL